MKHLKVTSVVLTIAICMSMFMPTVSVLADETAAPSEAQNVEETEKQTPKETVKPKETEKPAAQETEKQEPEKKEPAETEKQIPAETEKTEPAETDKQEPAETETQNPTETEKQEPAETEKQEPEQTESQVPEETEGEVPEITEAPVQETEDNKDAKNAIGHGYCGDNMEWSLTTDGVLSITGKGIMETNGWIQYKNSITTVSIGEGVKRLSYGAFEGCKNLTKISFPSTLEETAQYAFKDCTSLETVTVPFNVSWLAPGTFSGCTKLKTATLECNIEILESGCFENCTSLTSITIPSQVTIISVYAFRGCTKLSSVKFPDTLTQIQASAFEGCTSFTKFTVPYGVTYIGDEVFKNCTGLTSVELVSVNEIGKKAFEGCTGLETLKLPVSLNTVRHSVCTGCSALTDVYYNGTDVQWSNIEIAPDNSVLLKATIHTTSSSSFNGDSGTCGTNLKWTLNTAGTLTISGTGSMSNFDDHNLANTYYFYKAPWNNYKSIIKKVVISDGVTSIGNGAFNGCGKLTEISMPDSITAFGRDVFVNSGITSITIPAGVTIIEGYTFQNCTSLTSVTIPSSVTEIGKFAFAYCTNLTTVNLSYGTRIIGEYAFLDDAKLVNIMLPDSLTRIEASAFSSTGITEITIPGNLRYLGGYTFSKCSNLTKVTFSSGLTKIGSENDGGGDFSNCINLKTVIIPDTVTYIYNPTFNGSTNLTTVYYAGTENAWNAISGSSQAVLKNAKKIWGSTGVTKYNITVKSEHGDVTLSSNPAEAGETVTVTVDPKPGYTVSYIEADNTTLSGNSFTMPAKHITVKVVYSAKSFKLTVNSNGNGTASYYTSNVPVGDIVNLTIKSEEGYGVGSVKVNGADNGTETTFIMPAQDTTVYVTFVLQGHTIELLPCSHGSATLSKPAGSAGDTITVTPKPDDGYELDQIFVNGEALKAGVTQFTMGDEDTTVEVTFKKAAYPVSVSVPEGGTASANPTTAEAGTSIKISYTEADGYAFDYFTVNGDKKTGTSFTMPAKEAKVVVYFKKLSYSVSVSCSAGGTAYCKPTTASVGDTITVYTNSDTGYTVESIKVNNKVIEGNTFTMPAGKATVYVAFAKGGYPVNLTVGPNGTASVSKPMAGYGDEITVTANPETGYVLDTIKVDGEALEPGVTTFTMGAAATNVVVSFKKEYYKVDVSVHEGGTASAGVSSAAYGDTINITYSAHAGYEFDKILLNGETLTGNTFKMPAKVAEVVVCFRKISYTITVSYSAGGTAYCKPTTACVGDKITINTDPDTGYSVGTIKVNTKAIEGDSFYMPAQNTTVSVTFVKTDYPVNLEVGANGTARVSAETANMGDRITVTAIPATGYKVDTITFNNTPLTSNNNIYEFTMGAAEAKVVVTFKKESYSVTVSAPEGGTAKANTKTAGYGDVITITTSTETGYEFDKITVNGVDKEGKTFEMPAEDVAVVAYFKKIDYAVNLEVGDHGTASVSKNLANYGDNITITATPEKGYQLDKIKVNGTALGANVMEFTMKAGIANVEVTFKPEEYDIAVSVPQGGSAETNPSSACAGATVKVSYSAHTGYELDKITLNGRTLQSDEFTMPVGGASVVVYFKLTEYEIGLSVGEHGSAKLSKNPAYMGDTIDVIATPDAGYVLDKIVVNTTTLKAGVTSFVMGAAKYTVSVTFKKAQYPVNVTVSGEGGTASAKTSAAAEEWIEVSCNPKTGYEFDKITVNNVAITGTGFPMPAKEANVVVTFKKAVYKITLITPVGGTVTLSKTSANYNETISVTTTENTGYKLDKIYVNGIASSSKTSFTMPNEDAEVEVVFKLIDYDITVDCGANGKASVSKKSANYGDTIVITATPNTGYTIDTIKVNGKELVGTMEFTMGNAPAEVDVTFKRADYTITSSVSGGNGKVSVVKMANEGDTIAVECTPNTGYVVDKILVDNNEISGISFPMPGHNITVVVSFKLAVYNISINKPAGGTATLSQATANYGELITVTATPSTGYRLKSITVNDKVIEVESFSMPDKAAKVVVTFEKIDYEISLNQPAGGTVSVDKNPANYGDMITVTANPSEGYKLDTIKVNGKALASGVYTFKMSNASASVEATFKKIQYSISVTYSAGGTASASPAKAGINDQVTITPKPNTGYEVEYITVNAETGAETFLMPAKNTKVYVKFKKKDYKITVACGANGEAEVSKEEANIGDKITVTTNPIPGYTVDFIKVNEKTITGNSFTMAAGDTTVEVHFKLKDLKVKVTALTGGTATANVKTAKMGETVTLTVKPADGYELSYIMVNGKKESTSFIMGAEDADVTVAFAKKTYTVNLSTGSNGTAYIDKTSAVIDDEIKVTVKPVENYVATIKVNGESLGETNDELTFTMPATNVTVTVTFERIMQLSVGETGKAANATFTVTGAAPENGTGTVRLDKLEDNGTAAVVIPDTVSIKGYEYRVTSIASYALANNPSMTSLKIGAYVTSVGNYVASGCRNLTKVYGGNRLKTIGTRAFNGCSRLKSFNISSAVLSKIGAYSFNGDKALKTIYVNKTTKLTKKGVKKSLKGSKIKTVKVKKSKVRKYKKYFTKRNCGRKVKVKK